MKKWGMSIDIDIAKLLKAEYDKAVKTINRSVKQDIKEIKSKSSGINVKVVM